MTNPSLSRYERIDLNLFKVFDAVMTHRSVAVAGRELGVTASAVSHALTRLRKLLDDELFLPTPDGMVPTSRAAELAPSVRDAIANILVALQARPFDPAKAVRSFGLAMSELPGGIIVPRLLRRVLARAPHVSLRVIPVGRLDLVQQLEEGRVDVVVGWFDVLPDKIRRRTLLQEQESIVVRDGHPLTLGPVTRAKLLAYPHVVVEFTGSEEQPDDGFLTDRGVSRRVWIERLLVETSGRERLVGRVAATVPTFGLIAPILAVTDLVATLPLRLARQAVARDGLVLLELPYAPLTVAVEMVWHERADADPALRWLLDQVVAASDEADAAEFSA